MLRLLLALPAAPLLAAALSIVAAPEARAQTRAEIADAEFDACLEEWGARVSAGDLDAAEQDEGLSICVRERFPEIFKELDAATAEAASIVNEVENDLFVIQKAENWKGATSPPRLLLRCKGGGGAAPAEIDWNGSLVGHNSLATLPVRYRFDEDEAMIAYLFVTGDERTDFRPFHENQVISDHFDEKLLESAFLQTVVEKYSGGFIIAEFNLRDMRSKVALRC